ncbi:acyl-CoA dehydrogenase family protein [Aeromicrobium sp. CFBP 8757]|nr:acyl-CoA dehydrogenase family protein [Aeromicrobium sp. CFBP 8757]
MTDLPPSELLAIVDAFIDDARHLEADPRAYLAARFDAGLAWVHHRVGTGGLAAPRRLQGAVDEAFRVAGTPDNSYREPDVGLGMAAPTIETYCEPGLAARLLRPLYTGQERWCQLFSEPGAGSDLAAVSTKAARRDGGWVVDGQKVWTSNAHHARWGILLARSDAGVPKHQGLSFFVCDMTDPGVTVRPLRLLTGDAEFNEVFLEQVAIPDEHLVGAAGDGWRVAQTTLGNERVAIGATGGSTPHPASQIAERWRDEATVRTPDLHARLMRLWVEAEVYGWRSMQAAQSRAEDDSPGPAGSGMKLSFARLSQATTSLEVEMGAADGVAYDDWSMRLTEHADFTGRNPAYRYLRARGNSIEGGTSEILLNIIAERVLGLPPEPRTDKHLPFNQVAR